MKKGEERKRKGEGVRGRWAKKREGFEENERGSE
jgi:hypothetical protein